jgi:ribosomal protein S18 acetylase RimI-like enzyme
MLVWALIFAVWTLQKGAAAWVTSEISRSMPQRQFFYSACLPSTAHFPPLFMAQLDASEAIQYHVRDCTFAELNDVADVILESFYVNTTSPWTQLYRMGELNRIQQSFSYADKSRHRMLVAVVEKSGAGDRKTEHIVGFCDVDARAPNRPSSYQYNPRPYLSDLCVAISWRRRGIANALIKACEEFCVKEIARTSVFIRVEKGNFAALTMYKEMGYLRIQNPDDPLGNIILLCKKLSPPDTMESSDLMASDVLVAEVDGRLN